MEKTVRIFGTFAEAEAADREEDLCISPERRIEILLELQRRIYPDALEQRLALVCQVTQLSPSRSLA
jgi:hypothetical protein